MAAVESGLPKVQQEQSEALRIGIENKGAGIVHEDELRQSLAECRVSIKEMLAQPCQDDMECLWEKASICRIPQYLKNGKDKDYDPQIVSLGPYHHGKEHLRPMDQHKLRCLRRILKRSNNEIDPYLNSVKDVEGRARSCYDGMISMNSDDFVQMMVLDGCFVLELFLGFAVGFGQLGYRLSDPIFSMRGPMHTIQQDMILLENQIPLFILDLLLPLFPLNQLLGYDPNRNRLLVKLALEFFYSLQPIIIPFNGRTVDPSPIHGELHCLTLLWLSLSPSHIRLSPSRSLSLIEPVLPELSSRTIPCVTDLWKAGIEFSMRHTDSFMDIRFQKGTLKIPQLQIHDSTRSLFLNLIAFEQSRSDCIKYVASYVIFMDYLIKSPEDVGYLCHCKIIKHSLGSNAEVVAFFNQLCLGLDLDLNDHYLARLWKEYFTNPWSFISLVGGCILLVLACIQTFYTVYGYYRPRF
ncbi:hypothetical protein EUGRSUZ_I00875 [Eucalyptus grandis]|uniref:Uncharacterized protein n=2 Tax=Eucalyptus grandis TaxID=71139 RepID=A0ACC3JD05_EUCGR|nr:hypothetical protein EUGRSUZ_I00875 [Eucalyptus grandis]